MDDVWNDDQLKWNKLMLQFGNGTKGASVLVTTRLNNGRNDNSEDTHEESVLKAFQPKCKSQGFEGEWLSRDTISYLDEESFTSPRLLSKCASIVKGSLHLQPQCTKGIAYRPLSINGIFSGTHVARSDFPSNFEDYGLS
ncbi:unnamed protein product [Lupinus luteus]|uniref:NB-ARC domain-containing protein n=1 Tax=Lupinus luteus TaxID=3873 RepID=A0AAV1WQR6_LUPLU